jgi:hypothetical protein
MANFFGLGRASRLIIYTSTLRIPRGGSVGVDGQPRSFQGTAIPDYEATAAAAEQRVFSSAAPGVGGVSGWLRNLRFVDLDVVVQASPVDPDDVTRSDSFIAIGSPAYNTASARVESTFPATGRFNDASGTIEVDGLPPTARPDYSILERVHDRQSGQTAFYAAGHSLAGTSGAVNHLRSNWRTLAKHHKGDFCLLLRVNADGSNQEVVFDTTSPDRRAHRSESSSS